MSIDKLVSGIRHLSRGVLMVPILAAGLVSYACNNETPAGRLGETDAGYISDAQEGSLSIDGNTADAEADAIPYKELKVRVNFMEFSTDRSSAAGDDYLFDVEIESEHIEECRAQGRTGHSRFVQPEYLDLNLPAACSGELTKVNIFSYWHLSDILIDIDPEREHGRCSQTSVIDPEGCYISLDYSIGSALKGQVDGNDDNFLLDPFDGFLRYRIETL